MTRDPQPQPYIHLVRRADQPVQPWRNGGGVTRQVAIDPPDPPDAAPTDCRWRVSIAEVSGDGPFSPMPGVDRRLWLLRGKGMRLQVDGQIVVLDQPLQCFEFAGEVPIVASLIDGPCEDLNVMTSRAAVVAQADVVDLAAAAELMLPRAPQRLLVVLAGSGVLAGSHAAEAGDALRIDGGSNLPWRAGPEASRLLLLSCRNR